MLYLFIQKFYKGKKFPEEQFHRSMSGIFSITFQNAISYNNQQIRQIFASAKSDIICEREIFRIYRIKLQLARNEDTQIFLSQRYIYRKGYIIFFHQNKEFRLPKLKSL